MRRATWAMLILSFVSLRGVARAEDSNTVKAREHYQAGSRLFALGHFDEAIKEYEAAYELRDDPVFLYNIAQAHRLNRNSEKALFFYKSYLSHAGSPPNAGDVQKKIAELQALIDAQSRTQTAPPQGPISPERSPTTPPPTSATTTTTTGPAQPEQPQPTSTPVVTTNPPPADHAGRTKVIAGAVLIGGGAALLATGIALSVVAVNSGNEVKSAASSGGTFDPSLQDRAKTFQVVGPVLDGVGVAAAAGGVVLLIVGRRDARSHAAVVPVGGRGFAGLTYRTEF